MTITNQTPIDSQVGPVSTTRRFTWKRLAVPVTLGLFASAIVLHLFLVGREVSANELDDIFLREPLVASHGPWWQQWRFISLLLGLCFFGFILAFRLARRKDPSYGTWARIFAAGCALLVGVTAFTVEVPDVFRMGFSFTMFELPLRILLGCLAASALGLALGPIWPRWTRAARVGLVSSLVGVIGVLAIPQPSESHTPIQMAMLCDGRSNTCRDSYPSCKGPLEVEAHAQASPVALLPEAVSLQRRTIQRLEGRVAHLDRITAAVDNPAWAKLNPQVGYPDPRLRDEATNAALHIHYAHFRWLCIGLAILISLFLSIRSAVSARSWREREGTVGRVLFGVLGALALLAAFPLLAESTWVSPWQYLPTFLLGPLALLVLMATAWEAVSVRAPAPAPSAGVVDQCHGTIETPAGPWKVSQAGGQG